jgi:hypothetical protein
MPSKLLDRAVRGFLDEVPALKDLRLVVGVDLNGRGGDVQQFRIEMPDIDIRKDMGTDAKIRIEMRRDFFNLMVEHGAKVPTGSRRSTRAARRRRVSTSTSS